MNDAKYIGLDVHQATISATVLYSTGKLVMEAILETKAATILQFIHGLRGDLQVTFEEGTCAAWLHDLLKPYVRQVLVGQKRPNQRVQQLNRRQHFDFNPGCAAALAKSMAIEYMSRTPAHESCQ